MKTKIESLLREIVERNSITGNEAALGNYLFGYFQERGFNVIRQSIDSDRFNVIVSKGKGKKITLYSHLDTVGVVSGWLHDPYKLVVENDKAFGLGSYDMKGGMVANILTFLDCDLNNYELQLLFCADEENISKGGHTFINSEFSNDITCVVSPEPAFGMGSNGIVTGRVGRAVFSIKLEYPSQHFMYYQPQTDLNLLAGQICSQLNNFYRQQDEHKQFVQVRKYNSEATGMSTPAEVNIELEAAILPPLTNQQLLEQLREVVQKETTKFSKDIKATVDFRERQTPFLSPYNLDLGNVYLQTLMKSVVDVTNELAKPYFRSSVADDNIFGEKNIPVLGIGPEGGNAHGADEWVSLSSIEKLYQIIVNFIGKVDSSAIN